MDKTIHIELSANGIDKAIKEIEAFQSELNSRCAAAVTAVAQKGAEIIESNMPSGKTYDDKLIESGSDTTHTTTVSSASGTNPSATVTLEGPEIMFIEFGAGVHYNPKKVNSFGTYAIGSYGKGQGAFDRPWGYYDDGGLILSHGTQAAEPVFKAYTELRDGAGLEAAKEAFE